MHHTCFIKLGRAGYLTKPEASTECLGINKRSRQRQRQRQQMNANLNLLLPDGDTSTGDRKPLFASADSVAISTDQSEADANLNKEVSIVKKQSRLYHVRSGCGGSAEVNPNEFRRHRASDSTSCSTPEGGGGESKVGHLKLCYIDLITLYEREVVNSCYALFGSRVIIHRTQMSEMTIALKAGLC